MSDKKGMEKPLNSFTDYKLNHPLPFWQKADTLKNSTTEKKYFIAKVDIDVKPPDPWFKAWIETRKTILESMGLKLVKIRWVETVHGTHFWFHLNKGLTFEELMKLQFLLGDDHNRVYFGQQRMGFKKFRDKFNILFSKKIEIPNEEKLA